MRLQCAKTLCCAVAMSFVSALVLTAAVPAAAQTYTVLHNFAGAPNDGGESYAALVIDNSGNLYGTTAIGGVNNAGAVFELTANGGETVLHSFNSSDGAFPTGGLVFDQSGNLYGTTSSNGANGKGTVFEITSGGTFSTLYSFCSQPNCADGANPNDSLIFGKDGRLYGTTTGGGGGFGTVFALTPSGQETVLYSFQGGAGGSSPEAAVVADKLGNLYGTTYGGGLNYGTVFKVSLTGAHTVLHTFAGGSTDGAVPAASLVFDKSGNLYGTTYWGGSDNYGTAFKLTTRRKSKFSVLHSFALVDGGQPGGSLVFDKQGNLYSTTVIGGSNGCGTVFRINKSGNETLLYNLDCFTTGAFPHDGLVLDTNGNLYGTTTNYGGFSFGTVFKLTP